MEDAPPDGELLMQLEGEGGGAGAPESRSIEAALEPFTAEREMLEMGLQEAPRAGEPSCALEAAGDAPEADAVAGASETKASENTAMLQAGRDVFATLYSGGSEKLAADKAALEQDLRVSMTQIQWKELEYLRANWTIPCRDRWIKRFHSSILSLRWNT